MAITTQAQYRTHILLALKSTMQAEPRLLLPLLPGLIDYARTGQDPREAIEMLLTWAWARLYPSVSFSPHAWKHLLADSGVPDAFLADIPERAEP